MTEAEIKAFFAKLRDMLAKIRRDEEPSEAEIEALASQAIDVAELVVVKLASL